MLLCCFYLLLASDDVTLQDGTVPQNSGFQILECTRYIPSHLNPDKKGKIGIAGPQHCFVIFVRNGKKIDSRGYFADSGSIEEPEVAGFQKCRTVKQFTGEQAQLASTNWKNVTSVFDSKTPAQYDLTKHNCCSVAAEALRRIVDGKELLDVEKANCSVGTKIKS